MELSYFVYAQYDPTGIVSIVHEPTTTDLGNGSYWLIFLIYTGLTMNHYTNPHHTKVHVIPIGIHKH